MNKSLLIKYFYKGKVFLVIFSGGDRNKRFLIGKKLVVGSDTSHFWQIFNKQFPKSHDLVIKEDDKYYFNLLSTFSISVSKNKQELELDDLKMQGILKGNRLYLNEQLEGKIIVDQNTEFTFQYVPIKEGLTHEEKKMVALFQQWPKATAMQKATTYTVSSIVVLILVLATVLGWKYTPPKKSSIFDRVEREITILTEVSLKTPPADISFVDYQEETEDIADSTEEYVEDTKQKPTAQDAERRTEQSARLTERLKQRQSSASASKADRYQDIAGSGEGLDPSQVGTGSALAVRARVSGLQATGSREAYFTDVEIDTGSGYGEMAERLNRQKDDQLNVAAISSRGVRASELGGRRTTDLSARGSTAELEALETRLGDGTTSIEELGATALVGKAIDKGSVATTAGKNRVDLTDSQKESHLREWFLSRLNLQITEQYNAFKLRKPMKGELTFRFVFVKDIVVSIRVVGKGSIGDSEFTKNLEDIIKGRRCPNIGDYRGNITQYYE